MIQMRYDQRIPCLKEVTDELNLVRRERDICRDLFIKELVERHYMKRDKAEQLAQRAIAIRMEL